LAASTCTLVHISPVGPKQPFGVAPVHDSVAAPVHMPPWHTPPGAQALPHAPQLAGSLLRSVHIEPCGLGHICGLSGEQVMVPPAHMPPWQAAPGAHAMPQPPQFAGSLPRFVQYGVPAPGHAFGCAAGQVIEPPHAPPWQTTPVGQVRPQPPQFAASVLGSAQ
jgi:hypothetical protein